MRWMESKLEVVGAGDVEVAVGAERQVVGGDGRLERGEDENLAVGADLEDRAAAVADIEILLAVESNSGGNPHAFDENGHVAVGRRLVHETVVAAGDVEHALGVESQASGIHEVVDERLHGEVQVDLVDRYRNLLPARAAEGGVDIAERIDGRIGDGVEVLGDQNADIAGPGIAGLLAALDHQPSGRGALGDAGNHERIRADDHGRADFTDGDAGPVRFREALSSNLQLAAGDGGGRCDPGNLGPGVG